jgi:hypothetical protein
MVLKNLVYFILLNLSEWFEVILIGVGVYGRSIFKVESFGLGCSPDSCDKTIGRDELLLLPS